MGKFSFEKVYKVFLLFLTTWIGLGLLMSVIAPDLLMMQVLLTSSVIILLFLSVYLLSGKQKMIPIIITAVILSWIIFADLAATKEYIEAYFMWVIGQPITEFHNSFQYLNVMLVTLVFIPLTLLLERLPKFRIFTALLLFGGLLYGAYSGLEYEKIAVCFCILYITFIFTELLQDELFRQKIIVCLLPFLGIYMLMILILPTKEEPYEWKTVRTIYAQVYDVIVNISNSFSSSSVGNQEGFKLEVVGFSGAGRMGGNLANRIRDEMVITQTSGKRMSIYLRGNVFETFDGNVWNSNAIETEDEHILDLVETVYAIERFDPERRADYLTHSTLKVSYTDLNTNFLFAPLKVININQTSALGVVQYGSEFRFDTIRGSGTEYNFTYFQMNLGDKGFQEMIADQYQYQYDVNPPEYIRFDFLRISNEISESLEKKLKARSELIYEKYMEKYPISDGVRDLLSVITNDAENDFEKVKALERALSGQTNFNFTYTKTPGDLPKGKDFLDYFLLESKSGYCSYYATAFTLLVRELGLPARYVQGFMVYDDNLGRGPVLVRNTMAHAWSEVYFDGVGWIPFEPTPGFRGFRYQYWSPHSASGESLGTVRPPAIEPVEAAEDLSDSFSSDNEDTASLLTLILTIFATLVMAIALFIIVDYFIRKYRFSRYSINKQFTEHIRINLQILSCLGFNFLHGETIHEFKERIKESDASLPLSFLELCECFLYRKAVADAEMITLVLDDRDSLYEAIKENDEWRYYLVRFRMLLR